MNKFDVLKDVFGYTSFREGQENLIDNTLQGEDVLGIMPTGAGKSVCFQIPAVIFDGITIVISPLISLMIDQVQSLKDAGVAAAYINSTLTEGQITTAMKRGRQGAYKIIYVAPERLLTESFLSFTRHIKISMVAVDEAHCISQWGQDFRPSYLNIVEFINRLPERPVIGAYTATATVTVKEDIQRILNLENPQVVVTGYNRKNLFFGVKKPKSKMTELLSFLSENEGKSGIIYCSTRKAVDEVYTALRSRGTGVTKYHAGLSTEERRENQNRFIYDQLPIMVATNAFGMGIDKSNVRFVIHYNMPKDMESYYQEAGRAGRDGEDAECILYYSGRDVRINEFFIENQNENENLAEEEREAIKERDYSRLRKMTFYCFTNDCLRDYILRYFGEYGPNYCGKCNNCLTEFDDFDVTKESVTLIRLVHSSGERYGIVAIADAARGSENEKTRRFGLNGNSYFGALSKVSLPQIRIIINQLVIMEYFCVTKDKYPILKVTPEGKEAMEDENLSIIIKQPRNKETEQVKIKKTKSNNAKYPQLFEKLRVLRLEIAKEEHKPPYIIFSDKTLNEMSTYLPITRQKMLEINGVGATKLEKYGERFMKIIKDYSADLNK